MTTGVIEAMNSSLIIIGGERFFLGEINPEGKEIGDTVDYEADRSFLTRCDVVAKANGAPVPAADKKKNTTTKDPATQPQKCVMGECPDKGNHFAFNKQRNRWECTIMGFDNPNITHCPHVPKNVAGAGSTEYTDDQKKAGFGTPPAESKFQGIQVSGIYRGTSKDMIMLTVDGRNNAYSATRELIQYLKSKDCKAKPDQPVTITIEEKKDGSGSWATAIGPGPETGPTEQKPPAETPPPKKDAPAGPPAGSPPVAPAAGEGNDLQQIPHVPAAVVPYEGSSLKPMIEGPMRFDEAQINLIKSTVAKDCTITEFKLLMYLASQYHLDPIRKQIWAVKYGDAPASIFTGRDGFLAIAHRSGHLDGMKSGVMEKAFGDKTEMVGWCEIWRNDMTRPFYVEVYLSDYQQPMPRSGKPGLWQKMPRVMIQKVAESTCLRRAFSITGLYSPEEIDNGGA